MRITHEIKPDDTFDFHHAIHLLNFNDSVRRKSTGLILNPDTWLTQIINDEDRQATDWQLILPPPKEYK